MTPPPDGPVPDGPRDRRIEEPTNLWLIHPLSRALLRPAVRLGISANAVSAAGLAVGAGAALAFGHWRSPATAVLGLVLAAGWLVLDGLDGMVARATGTASPLGRLMDGVCDHGVFILIYVGLALSIGTAGAWALAAAAGAAHGFQSSFYEGERARFHRRLRRAPPPPPSPSPAAWLVGAYDRIATGLDRLGAPLDAGLAGPDGVRLARRYGERAARPMRLLALLSANTRVELIAIACLAGNPRLFWWAELLPLTAIALVGLVWHRRVESALARALPSRPAAATPRPATDTLLFKDHVH